MRNKEQKKHKSDRGKFERLKGKYREAVKDIKKLKRLNSRLPVEGSSDSWDEMDNAPTDGLMEEMPKCPKCGENSLKIVELRGLPYGFCSNTICEWRGKIK